jgi:hypothetical protein
MGARVEHRITRVKDQESGSDLEERMQYVRLEIWSYGKPYEGETELQHRISTLAKERHEILEFGGRFDLKSTTDGALAVLILISRHAERALGFSASGSNSGGGTT